MVYIQYFHAFWNGQNQCHPNCWFLPFRMFSFLIIAQETSFCELSVSGMVMCLCRWSREEQRVSWVWPWPMFMPRGLWRLSLGNSETCLDLEPLIHYKVFFHVIGQTETQRFHGVLITIFSSGLILVTCCSKELEYWKGKDTWKRKWDAERRRRGKWREWDSSLLTLLKSYPK